MPRYPRNAPFSWPHTLRCQYVVIFSWPSTVRITSHRSQVAVLKSFCFSGLSPSVENAAASCDCHQPYALVHTAFFLNSGRTLRDSRVARRTRTQDRVMHLTELCCVWKDHLDQKGVKTVNRRFCRTTDVWPASDNCFLMSLLFTWNAASVTIYFKFVFFYTWTGLSPLNV